MRSPAKSGRIAVTEREKQADTAVLVGEVQNVRLAVFGDSVVMTADGQFAALSRSACGPSAAVGGP